MGVVEILILAALAIWLVFAVRHIIKTRGSCGGNCANCPHKCKKER